MYHKVTRNESKESYADKKLDHSPIVTYLEKGKTIGLHQELDITDGMVELDGEPLSSADVEISIWLGQKWFESFLAMWVVNELPPRTPLMEIKKKHRNAIERNISYSDLSSLLCQKVPFDNRIGDLSESFYHYLGAVHRHDSDDKVRHLKSVLSDFLRSPKHHKTLMGDFNADQQGASEESLADQKSQHRTCPTVTTDTESSRITPVHSKNHRGYSSNGIDVDQNTASTTGEQERSRTMTSFDISEGDWQYTLALKEKGDQERVVPSYDEKRQKAYPPLWMVTVAYDSITETGQAKSKREARHLASKKAWYKLGGGQLPGSERSQVNQQA